MLIIHNKGKYNEFNRFGKKPSDFSKVNLQIHNVKSYDFVKAYFDDLESLMSAIWEYKRTADIQRGEFTLAELLK